MTRSAVAVGDKDSPARLVMLYESGPPGQPGTPGASGAMGQKGDPGVPGAAGAGAFSYEQVFSTPSDTWVVVHNRGTRNLDVEVLDQNDAVVEGVVTYSLDSVTINWWYPETGTVRLRA